MITPDENGLIICPNCRKEYKPILERKGNELLQISHPTATPEEREQLISGICCNKCWDNFVGLPKRDY